MAWYRCGGGGLPAGLQSDMDTVLNKKFSTSTTYPPTDWPDTVNLMGPLPEKTASSASVCSFSDGADDVPIKSVIAHIAPTLTGTNAVNMVQSGKNLLVNNIQDGVTGGITYTKNSDGSISCVGKVTNVNSTRVIATNIKLPVGSYVLSGGNSSIRLRCTIYDKDGTYTARNDTGNGVTVSVIATTDYLEFRILARTIDEEVNTIVYPQFETGSTATAYEPYTAPTQYTANLGRTIYGGTADIVNGIGTDENGDDFTFDGQEIPSMLGTNNLWHDAGETECTYRADISLALQALGGGGRGLMMMRPTEQEETEETEGLEDELNR